MKKTSLIDGDIVAYRCAATCNNDPFKIAVYRMEDMLDGIFRASASDQYKMYLSDSTNYRYTIYPAYKANRIGMPKPIHLDNCKNYLVKKWNAEIAEGMEADDYLGIEQCRNLDNTSICSIDKDLLMIPGWHYNIVKQIKTLVTPTEGLRHFFSQLLIGDTSDNVHGIRGIGKVKTAKLLNHLDSKEEMFDCVRGLYKDDVRLLMNCDVLWIQQKEGVVFSQEYLPMLKEFGLHATIEC
jgi:5'-3' exonuclease